MWLEESTKDSYSDKTAPQQNRLLSALDEESKLRIFKNLELVSMPLGMVIYESGDRLSHVYFPTNCIVSLIYEMENGATAEIAIVGNEGMIGIALITGGESTPSRAIVQSAGMAYRLSGECIKAEFYRHGEMLDHIRISHQGLEFWVNVSIQAEQSSAET